jgi:threonine dehydrogenase-like Zn-dependent dehydrogenase
MKVVKAFGPKDLRIVESPVPVPGSGQVLIKIRSSGICGSDKWYWRVNGPVDAVAGHEIAGEIVDCGPGVRKLKTGDRVAVNNVVGCGECEACRNGEFVRCPRRPDKDVNNGFGEYAAAPERNCLKLHPKIGYEAGCLIFDNWGTPFAALSRTGLKAGDRVIVFGCGPIGLAATGLCASRKASVLAVDPLEFRRNAALRLGAEKAMPPDQATGSGEGLPGWGKADFVIECSGKAPAYAAGLDALRIGGTFVSVGEGAEYQLRPSDTIIRNHLNMLGSWYSTMKQGAEVQKMMISGKIRNPSAFVTHRLKLEEVPGFFGGFMDCAAGILKPVIQID